MIISPFKRYIRAEVVTYRLDVAFGSLHTLQLHCFDELRHDQGIIQNRSAEIGKMAASLYLPSSHSSFRFLRLIQKNRANKNRVFGRSDGGQDNMNKSVPCSTRKIWTSGTCRNSSRMNCMCGTRDTALPQSHGFQSIPCRR
jgi:hypothetical protein